MDTEEEEQIMRDHDKQESLVAEMAEKFKKQSKAKMLEAIES